MRLGGGLLGVGEFVFIVIDEGYDIYICINDIVG